MHFFTNEEHDSKKIERIKKKNGSVRKRNDQNRKNFWKQGEALSKRDLELLQEVIDVYERQGYIPSKKEVSNVCDLKGRFRTWKDVLLAAGLPSIHDAKQVQKRQQAAMAKKKI